MTRYQIKNPSSVWLRRVSIALSLAVILIGAVLLIIGFYGTGSIIEYPPVRPLGFGLLFGTPFGAFFVFKDLQRLNKKGPFGFDLVFIRLLISTLWVSAISLAAYLVAIMPYGSSQADPETLLLGLVVVLSVIVFGVILIICISVPFALVIAGLFRIIALERVDDRSDKTSWKRAV